MAALDVEALPPEQEMPGTVSTRRLEGTLVKPRVSKPVPNHLADTKIFSKSQRNGILQTKPSVIHFDGYQVGEVHQQTLQIINASRDNQQMHIIPPTTPFFSIKYSKKRSSLVPGLSLDVVVTFRPKEWRYYYDCIKVHCKDEQNLLIPIHAYPVINTRNFPRHIKFLSTPIGQRRTKTVSLECDVPVEFEYQLSYLHSHPSFTVEPMKGTIPANGKMDILITFTPTEYNTAVIELKLEMSQFNSRPILCTVTGCCAPGLAADNLRHETAKMSQQLKQHKLTLKSSTPHHLPPLDKTPKSSSHKITKKKSTSLQSNTTVASKGEEDVVKDGYRFPASLDNPGAIAKVLAQQPGKAKASELRQAASQTSGVVGGASSQRMKEALFLQEVRQAATEERANQLRWVTNLGGVAVTEEEREAVVKSRMEAQAIYQRRAEPSEEDQLDRGTTCLRKRTRRRAREIPSHVPTFDPYVNNAWERRYTSLQRFVQAARKVVMEIRRKERLGRLKILADRVKEGDTLEEALDEISGKKSNDIDITLRLTSDHQKIHPPSFPTHDSDPEYDEEGNLIVNGVPLKKVDVPPINVEDYLEEDYPVLKPMVPLDYELRGYRPLPLPDPFASRTRGLPRKLRTGALEEFENLAPIPGVDPQFLTNDAFTSLPVGAEICRRGLEDSSDIDDEQLMKKLEAKKKVLDFEETDLSEELKQLQVHDIEEGVAEMEGCVVSLKPPVNMFKSPQLHPLHIFHPAPGVTSHVPMLPHSEVSLDHALLPLPTHSSSELPHVRLHPLSVIPGVMEWKKFPSNCLLAMDGERKMATVFKPRRSDPFSTDLLPGMDDVELLSGPQFDDMVDLESSEVQPVPTMEMVRSQFNLPTSSTSPPTITLDDQLITGDVKKLPSLAPSQDSGPDLRQLAEEQLDNEKASQLNQLGSKVDERWSMYRDLLGSQVQLSLHGNSDCSDTV